MLLDICLKPNLKDKMLNTWRENIYWVEEIDALYKIYFKVMW